MRKIYGKVETNEQLIADRSVSRPDYIRMPCERPTPDHIAQEDGTWAFDKSPLYKAVNAKRNKILQQGIFYAGHTYQTGPIPNTTGSTYESSYFALLAVGEGGTVRTVDNIEVTMTNIHIKQLCEVFVSLTEACQARVNELDTMIDNAETAEDIAVVIAAIEEGWPDTPYHKPV